MAHLATIKSGTVFHREDYHPTRHGQIRINSNSDPAAIADKIDSEKNR